MPPRHTHALMWRLKPDFRTHNVAHSKFDDYILGFAFTLNVGIFIMNTISCAYTSDCLMEQVANASGVLAMGFEWLVLRNMYTGILSAYYLRISIYLFLRMGFTPNGK